jgi:hypothetical protein
MCVCLLLKKLIFPQYNPSLCILDPTVPKFREWLCHLGAGEFVNAFLKAGYDLTFVANHGISKDDLDCIGIPMSKLGLRRKIEALHDLNKFYVANNEDQDADDEEGEGDEDDEVDEDEADEDQDDEDDD